MPHRLIREIIDRRPTPTASPSATVRDAAVTMREFHSSAVLVVEDGIVAGIVTERDLVFGILAAERDPLQTQVGAIMTRTVQTIGPDKPFGHALHLMYEGGFRHVPVVDREGRPLGLLAAHDAIDTDSVVLQQELVRREEIAMIL